MYTVIAIIMGIILDFILGDPQGLLHPVILIGRLIAGTERVVRKHISATKTAERIGGTLLVIWVLGCVSFVYGLLCLISWKIHPICYLFVATIICYQMLATKCLKVESMKVYEELSKGDLIKAREAVSMIVGRDTNQLSASGVAKAAVETIAENTSDGSIAPLFYMILFGPMGCVLYKTINTMDSMIAYKNDTYRYFGTAAARLDDVANFIPSRLAALFMIVAAKLAGMDARQATRIFLRDRKKSPSPNSAQTESVCAGALGVSLLGDTVYFGQVHHKEEIGDAVREIEAQDIIRANRLLYLTMILSSVCLVTLRILICILLQN